HWVCGFVAAAFFAIAGMLRRLSFVCRSRASCSHRSALASRSSKLIGAGLVIWMQQLPLCGLSSTLSGRAQTCSLQPLDALFDFYLSLGLFSCGSRRSLSQVRQE